MKGYLWSQSPIQILRAEITIKQFELFVTMLSQLQFSCIYPSDTQKCTPGLYPTIHKLQLVEKISSARRGCQEGSPIKTHLGAIWRHSASGAFGLLCPSCNKSSFQR